MSLLIHLLIFCIAAFAYIPKFWMIVSRTAENHGTHVYVVDQEVTLYPAEGRPMVVTEQWLVNGENDLRMRAQSKRNFDSPLDITYVYDSVKRTYIDSKGKKQSVGLHKDWIEPYFYFRKDRFLKNKLLAMNAIPNSALKGPTNYRKKEDVKHDSEYFVRLSRTGGKINYAIGLPTPTGSKPLPGVWIEQDAFNITKLRLPSAAEVNAEDYVRHRNNLWLPQVRQISWEDKRATIRVTNVKNTGLTSYYKTRLSTRSLIPDKEPHLVMQLPENELVKEFYTRFR